MATKVEMPQMGESVVEGTILTWLKKEGDTVERRRAARRGVHGQGRHRDPVPGRRNAREDPRPGRRDGRDRDGPVRGGRIGGAAGEAPAKEEAPAEEEAPAKEEEPEKDSPAETPEEQTEATPPEDEVEEKVEEAEEPPQEAPAKSEPKKAPAPAKAPERPAATKDGRLHRRPTADRSCRRSCAGSRASTTSTSRRCAAPGPADASRRTTCSRSSRAARKPLLPLRPPTDSAPRRRSIGRQSAPPPTREAAGERTEVQPLTHIRKRIAEHMRGSLDTAARAWNVIEVDMEEIAKLRARDEGRLQEARRVLAHVPAVHLAGGVRRARRRTRS